MARQQRLQPAQIIPAAKPISTFVPQQAKNVSGPAKPAKFGAPKGTQTIQSRGVSNVKGYTSAEQLAEALGKFTKAVDAGLTVYATSEYEKGQNEVLKMNTLLQKRQYNSAKEYGDVNKTLEKTNPVAALEMDKVNPFRKAGRVNQASVITGTLVGPAFDKAWSENGSELALLEPGDPKINEVKSEVIKEITSVYGLDENSNGFVEKVLPQINKEWQRFSDKQFNANLKHKKHYMKLQTADGFMQLLMNTKDPTQLNLETSKFWTERIRLSGLGGEATKMIEDAILKTGRDLKYKAIQGEGNARELLNKMLLLPSHMPGIDGLPQSIGEAYGSSLYLESGKVADAQYKMEQTKQKNLMTDAELTYGNLFFNNRNDYGKIQELKEQLLNDPDLKDMEPNKKVELIERYTKTNTKYFEDSVDRTKVNNFFAKQEQLIGIDFNPGEFTTGFNSLMDDENIVHPNAVETRIKLRKRANDLLTQKNTAVSNSFDSDLRNSTVKNNLSLILEKELPGIDTAFLSDEDIDLMDILQYGDQAENQTVNNVLNHLLVITKDALSNAVTDNNIGDGGRLPIDIQNKVMRNAIEDYKKSELYQEHIRKPSDVKNQSSTSVNTSTTSNQEQSEKPAPIVYGQYGITTQVPEQDRNSFKDGVPLYNYRSIKSAWELKDKLPWRFKQTATDMGISPEELLLWHLDYYKNEADAVEWMPDKEERDKYKANGLQAKGMNDGFLAGSPHNSPLSNSSRVFNNILLGV